ncbi:MAG: PAS domain-containing protein, partial [bacterium]
GQYNYIERKNDTLVAESFTPALREKGAYLSITARSLTDTNGIMIGAIESFRDVTDLRLTEQKLKDSRQRLELALTGANLGMWTWNIQTDELTLNERCAEMLGYSLAEIEPHMSWWRKLIHPDDSRRVMTLFNKHLEGHTPSYECSYRMCTKSGEWRWILAHGKVVEYDQEGYALRASGTHLDITEHKQAEEEKNKLTGQLFQSQKMEAIGQLAGGVAHDFNNLLTVIIGNLSLAETGNSKEINKYLEMASNAANRAENLVKQLLAFSRKSPVDLKPLDINPILHDVSRLARQTIDRRIEIEIHTREHLPKTFADAAHVNSVLMNLCVNARDAITGIIEGRTLPGRRKDRFVITMETDVATIDEHYCEIHSYARPGEFVVLTVSDNGIGMTPETQRRVFEPFFTTKEIGKGTGLGLASAYGILKQHGGWINVYSEQGVGSTFKVYLPVFEGEFREKDAEKKPEIQGGNETILFADDEEMLRDLGQAILQVHGYNLLLAADGKEALELYSRERNRIDLVILDLSMPFLSGREVLDQISAIDPRAKVIVTSGYSDKVYMNGNAKLHTSAYIPKPYHPEDLARTVREVLDKPHRG